MDNELTKGVECVGCYGIVEKCKGHLPGKECVNYHNRPDKRKVKNEEQGEQSEQAY